ncbi:elongation factor P hydroxylase [Litorivivens sp.]|uniref:elongation factor P hydroxylase n=2 Tax=Litorivivens sp. TaxID=2020868 RepID=UPI0035639BDE
MFDGTPAPVEERQQLQAIVAVFSGEFASMDTVLCPGAEEPYYQPAQHGEPAKIFSRENFPASALHEVAHWCIAGEARRKLPDFGYWYAADGRNAAQQRAFQQVEVKPQAIEWAFSRAIGIPFRVSIDNLNGEAVDPFGFELAVWQQACRYYQCGLPPRAAQFCRALEQFFGRSSPAPELMRLRGELG